MPMSLTHGSIEERLHKFSCSWPDCNKAYKKEEHLERHLRTHTGDHEHVCQTCNRHYARSDVLSRHMVQHHGASPPALGRPRNTRSRSPRRAALPFPTSLGASPSSAPIPMMTDSTTSNMHQLAIGQNTTDMLMLASATSQDVDILSLFDMEPFIGGTFDWGFGEADGNIFDVLNTNTRNSPALVDTAGDVIIQPDPIHGSPSEIPDGQPYDSPWPHIYKPRTPDAHINLPPAPSVAERPLITPTDVISPECRGTMLRLVEHSNRNMWPAVDVGNFPSTQTLTECVNLYQRHFHDNLPILDQSAFSLASAPPMLLLAMASIGAVYSREQLQRVGIALSELVRRSILFIREHDRRFMFETNIIQSSLLQASFGIFCGSPKLFQQAESLRGMLVVACKRMHLLRPGLTAMEVLRNRRETPSVMEVEDANREDARRLRLGWGIYVFDAQLACLMNVPAHLSLSEISAALPTVEPLLFDMISPQSTTSSQLDGPSMFPIILSNLLNLGTFKTPLTDWGYNIIAHTLYRMCCDAASLQLLTVPVTAANRYVLSFPSHIKHHPQELLDRLAGHALQTAATPNSLLISCAALAFHSHINFTRIGFLEKVKIAAGKSGRVSTRQNARLSLREWINQDPMATRNIFAHAAKLISLLNRYTFDAPSEVVWRFDAALALWAITRFSDIPLASPGHDAVISWARSAKVDEWIEQGGSASILGLGEVFTLSHLTVLEASAKGLEGMSWGLAERYRQVLSGLMQEGM